MTTEWTRCDDGLPPLEDDGRSDHVLVLFDDGAFAVLFYDYDSIGWFDSYGSECSGYAAARIGAKMKTRLTTEVNVWLGILAAGSLFWWGMFRLVEWAVFGGWHL